MWHWEENPDIWLKSSRAALSAPSRLAAETTAQRKEAAVCPLKSRGEIKRLKGKETARDKMGSFRSRRRNAAENENHLKALGVIKWNSHSYSTQELLSVYMRLLFYFMYMIILYREVWKEL